MLSYRGALVFSPGPELHNRHNNSTLSSLGAIIFGGRPEAASFAKAASAFIAFCASTPSNARQRCSPQKQAYEVVRPARSCSRRVFAKTSHIEEGLVLDSRSKRTPSEQVEERLVGMREGAFLSASRLRTLVRRRLSDRE